MSAMLQSEMKTLVAPVSGLHGVMELDAYLVVVVPDWLSGTGDWYVCHSCVLDQPYAWRLSHASGFAVNDSGAETPEEALRIGLEKLERYIDNAGREALMKHIDQANYNLELALLNEEIRHRDETA